LLAGTMSTDSLNAVITHRIDINDGLAIFRVVPEGWELPDFLPGQFAALGLPSDAPRVEGSDTEGIIDGTGPLIKRAYSIASSSVAKEHVEFYVALVPSGALTPRLFALQPGQKIWMSTKFTGMFTLDQVPPDKNVVFFATGTGIAPYMSMIRTHLASDHDRKFAVLHGARRSSDLGYRVELVYLMRTHRNLTYIPVVSETDKEHRPWEGPTGFLQDLWSTRPLDPVWGSRLAPENSHVFLCGNPLMIQNMLAVLKEEGFKEHSKRAPGEIHMEKYW
jgi:ferredoxin--NADP+ reductase